MQTQEITLTAKIRLYPDKQQEALLIRTLEAYRKACCRVSAYIYASHDLTRASVNKALYQELRDDYNMRSQMAQSAIRDTIGAYKAMLSNEHPWTEVKFKKPVYTLVWNRDYSLVSGRFSVNTLEGRARIPFNNASMERYFEDPAWRFGSAKLVWKHGKWFLHASVSCFAETPGSNGYKNICGVDLGINFLWASHDSSGRSLFYNGHAVKEKKARYRRLRQDLQRMHTGSARRRLKQIGRRENRWMRDVNHCASKALVASQPANTLFVLEDLSGIHEGIREKVRKKSDRSMLVSWAFYDLGEKIAYKAMLDNSSVVKVPPAYTSQQCPRCGHVEKANRNRKLHRFECRTCHYRSNDDRVGAMNLYHKGILLVPGTVQ